ncbi:hypothetical protein Q9S36_06900 [Microbacterium sp. ARD31]|uniref:hypothetical protein n=1 Tax=Microbacterium sp. ARD31 TaxID=2962576 RepID=UPI002881177B|nr:hypothetical protein [Microbacterium sp. ARD31]MDT0179938.1 hypothetical protein [Microbacterium sp. ARD31]
MPHSSLTRPRGPVALAVDERRERFAVLIRQEDVLHTFDGVDLDLLVSFARGLALEAYEGRYEAARWQAREFYGIPEDACDLATAVALTVYTPRMTAALISRPNEGTMQQLRRKLRLHGLNLTVEAAR